MTSPNALLCQAEAHNAGSAVKTHQANPIANGENEVLNKMTELLKGIAPASHKLSCAEMLQNLERHKDLLQLPKTQFVVYEDTPKVFYLNSCDVSEKIADLSLKLQTKFIQHETLTSYSIWSETARQLANSALKRRQLTGISPGRRLSHLAKRRQMFSKANLLQLAQNEPKNQRLAIKTCNNQRNLAKEYLEFKKTVRPVIPKRALFQSPDGPLVRPGFQTVAKQVPRRRLFADLNKNAPAQEPPNGGGCYDVSGWLASQPFVNNRKRARDDSIGNNPKRRCPRRSLDFSGASPSDASQVSSHCSSTPILTLTNLHKQKLLWAVATTLKEKKITHKHHQFKDSARKLFNQCRKNLATILALQVPSGTTEKMLSYARHHVDIILSNSVVNQSQPETLIHGEDKENVNRTPRRVVKPRMWRTCTKNLKKCNPLRLNRSFSCDDLKDNLKTGCKRKRELAETVPSLDVTNVIENVPGNSETVVLVAESPEIGENRFCLQASHEDSEPILFPALARKQPMPASPDLFDNDDEAKDEPDGNFSSLEIPQQSNFIEHFPTADESALPGDISNILLDLSCIQNDVEQEISTENVVADVEDNNDLSETLSDNEDPMCTSTPMVSVPKRILRRNKPAWKVEAGPGLKIRVRLSKEWDVVGRQTIGSEETSTDLDLKPTVQTPIHNPLLARLSSVETTSSSTDNYNLMELRDKLEIERTLDADPSDFSFFESSPSLSNSDTSHEKRTIVEIAPEVTIKCYSSKSISDSDSSSSDDDNEPLSVLKQQNCKVKPVSQLIDANSERTEQQDNTSEDEQPLSQLVAPNLQRIKLGDDSNEDEHPLSQFIRSESEETKQKDEFNQVSADHHEITRPGAYPKKVSLETYYARRSSVKTVRSASTPPKKIYNIRLKKKQGVEDSRRLTPMPAIDFKEIIEKSERIFCETSSNFAWFIHQKMQSTILDDTDFESKLEKLNKLNEVSVAHQQFFARVQKETLELREKLDCPS